MNFLILEIHIDPIGFTLIKFFPFKNTKKVFFAYNIDNLYFHIKSVIYSYVTQIRKKKKIGNCLLLISFLYLRSRIKSVIIFPQYIYKMA